jgi:hypothetical protein
LSVLTASMRLIRCWYGAELSGLVEGAHGLLDDPDQVGQPIRHGGIDRDVVMLRLRPEVGAPRLEDGAPQDGALGVSLSGGLLIDQYGRDLLEIQQPVRQLQIARIEQLGAVREPAAVLVVRVQHDDVTEGMGVQDRPQDHGHRAGLAGARGAEHREMLAQQIVGDRERREIGGVLERADAHGRSLGPRIDRAQLLAAGGVDRAVQCRMAGDAALEPPAMRTGIQDLTEQPDLDQPAVVLDAAAAVVLEGGDHPEAARRRPLQAHDRADLDGAGRRCFDDTPDQRTRDRDDPADTGAGVGLGRPLGTDPGRCAGPCRRRRHPPLLGGIGRLGHRGGWPLGAFGRGRGGRACPPHRRVRLFGRGRGWRRSLVVPARRFLTLGRKPVVPLRRLAGFPIGAPERLGGRCVLSRFRRHRPRRWRLVCRRLDGFPAMAQPCPHRRPGSAAARGVLRAVDRALLGPR